jgi:hypothetical protein
METITQQASAARRALNVESIRGIYHRGAGHRWELAPPAGKAGCWRNQEMLPRAFIITDAAALQPLCEDRADARYPAEIALAPVHEGVARGHLSHYVRGAGHLSMGSLYIYAPTPTERWVEMVTTGMDVDDAQQSERRIVSLMSNGDADIARRCSQSLRRHLMKHTPATLFSPAAWLR